MMNSTPLSIPLLESKKTKSLQASNKTNSIANELEARLALAEGSGVTSVGDDAESGIGLVSLNPGVDAPSSAAIPLLDVSGIMELNSIDDASKVPEELRKKCSAVGNALETIGFFIALPTHGVDGLKGVEDAARKFFALPREQRDSVHMSHNATYRGYTDLGGETTSGRKDFKACYDLGTHHPENEGVNTFLGANLYPSEELVPGFKAAVDKYHDEMRSFGEAIVRAAAVHLGLPIDCMVTKKGTKCENHLYRLLSYPAKPAGVAAPINPLGQHFDYGLSAMIYTTGPGLEVFSNEGEWVKAPYIPGSIIYNSGDMMEAWTNGRIKSTLHRVVHDNAFQRLSFPFFYEPSYDTTIAPFGNLGKDRLMYEPVKYADHVRDGTSKSFANHIFSKLWDQEKAQRLAETDSEENSETSSSDEGEKDSSGVRLRKDSIFASTPVGSVSPRDASPRAHFASSH